MTEQKLKYISIPDYLALEEQSEEKHEYEAGQIKAMSGGTINHGRIGTNMTVALANSLGNSDCEALHNDVRVWIEAASSFVYPDVAANATNIDQTDKKE
jgi:Uma2 family endonuclease